MSPEAAIYLVILLCVIVGVAALLDWIARKKIGAPQLASIIIWVIAALLVLLALLRSGMLTGVG